MIEITKKKKVILIVLAVIIILSFVTLTYAYFTAASISGNVSESNVTTLTSDYGLITIRYYDNNVINSSSVMLNENGQDYNELLKFSIENEGTVNQDIIIHWDGLTNGFCKYQADGRCTDLSTDTDVRNELNYTLYECDSLGDYNSATVNDMTGCTDNVSVLNTTVPPTGSTANIHSASAITINEGITKYYIFVLTIENLDVPQNYNQGKEITAKLIVDYKDASELANTIVKKYPPTSDSSLLFGVVSSNTNGKGLYYNNKINVVSDQTIGKVRYFRGEVDNYVSFAGIIWRVLRIEENGNVRLITQNTYSAGGTFNSSDSGVHFVGYTYGDDNTSRLDGTIGTDSTIKTALDGWYTTNLSTYSSYINQNTAFCNDTSGSNDSFGPTLRLNSAKTPTFNCPATSQTYGGIYNLPIGTINADEAAYAGSVYDVNSSYYLNNGTSFWSLSPCESYNDYAGVYYSTSTGKLSSMGVDQTDAGYRPVIELKKEVYVESGNGTSLEPWTIET